MHGFDWFRAAAAWGGLRLVLVLESLLHSRLLRGARALLYAKSSLCSAHKLGSNARRAAGLEFRHRVLAACKTLEIWDEICDESPGAGRGPAKPRKTRRLN